MELDYKIIGICGNARSGKDTLGKNIKKILKDNGIKSEIYSFAHELKRSVDQFLIDQLNISAFTEDDEEKKIIRPFLVFWGTDVMRKRNKNIWVEKLEDKLYDTHVSIVTDVRFINEIDWVKRKNGLSIMIKRENNEPANAYEKYNNEKLSLVVDNSFNVLDTEDNKMLELTANEILNSTINKEIFELWKATCPL